LLRPGVAKRGYPSVCLGRRNSRTVHSLVLEAFVGPAFGRDVRHKDGSKTNNALINLEYGTRTENILDAVRHGTWLSEKRRQHLARLHQRQRIAA
jgi:hypothetical protein